MDTSGRWLEEALLELCQKKETGLDLDADIISGLVSYCQMASHVDAKEYLDNIIGQEAGKSVIEEYMKRRGHSDVYTTAQTSSSGLQAYVKPTSNVTNVATASKKTVKVPKEASTPIKVESRASVDTSESQKVKSGNQGSTSKKKKSGKVISLAEASNGSIVYQQGKPCSCQARQHRLVSNCLSCGKIVCEQEGEGPCNFCGALVLKEGSSYAGLSEGAVPLTKDEVVAEAYAKRLVEYDRNSAARTTVIDDQSDYYGIEGNSWLSKEEKELLMKKRDEIEEAERAQKSRVIMTFDLVGRKVLVNQDQATEELGNMILFQTLDEREATRIKPSPNLKVQPTFVDPGPRKTSKQSKSLNKGLCLEISGRVQHDTSDQRHLVAGDMVATPS